MERPSGALESEKAEQSISPPSEPNTPPLGSSAGRAPLSTAGTITATLPLMMRTVARSGVSPRRGRRKEKLGLFYARVDDNGDDGGQESLGSGEVAKVDEEVGEKTSDKQNTLVVVENGMMEVGSTVLERAAAVGYVVLRTLKNVLPGFIKSSRQGRSFTEILVFMFFMVVVLFLLHVADRQLELMIRVLKQHNERNLVVASSLTEQLLEKAREVNELMKPFKRTPSAVLEKARMSLEELTELRDLSIQELHSRMLYKGSIDDIKFLVEEHVVYKMNLAKVAKEELQWLNNKRHERFTRLTSNNSALSMRGSRRRNDPKRGDKGHHHKATKTEIRLQQRTVKPIPENSRSKSDEGESLFSYVLNRAMILLGVFLLTVLYFRVQ